MKDTTLSLIVPVRDNAANLTSLVMECLAVLPRHVADYEIIIVDDGSRDATPTLAANLAAVHDPVMVIHHPRPRGFAGALLSGWNAARGESILCLGASGAVSISELVRLMPYVDRYDMVVGYYRDKAALKHIGNKLRTRATNTLFDLDLHDLHCGFSLFRADLRRLLPADGAHAGIGVELYARARQEGIPTIQVEVSHSMQPGYGTLEQRPSVGDLIQLWLRLRAGQQLEKTGPRPLWRQRPLLGTLLAVLVAGGWLLRRRHLPRR